MKTREDRSRLSGCAVVVAICLMVAPAFGAVSLTQYGITWTFDRNYTTGQYANGDYWVVGPVKIVSISNQFHAADSGLDGSMVNPGVTASQGYDNRLGNYTEALNAAKSPLELAGDSSLISSVSWLTGEPGCPKLSGKVPRPLIRTMAILTCVSDAPPAGSFRPAYCGTDKSARFNVSRLNRALLRNLVRPAGTPDLKTMEASFSGPWVDHVNGWQGGMTHPDMHMPNYGRDLSILIGEAALMLQLDFSGPDKEKLLVEFVQLGIDLAGIADAGGGWPSDGGHGMGRKWPILFAGLMLNDAHMRDVGRWKTSFQEDMDTFYVSEESVAVTAGSKWAPDKRHPALPYEAAHLGLPEWGIRHKDYPTKDNLHWEAIYRDINNQGYPGWVLAALIMDQREAWNHDALFDYIDRSIAVGPKLGANDLAVFGTAFIKNMWLTYRKSLGPVWMPETPSDFYSRGARISVKD